MRFIPVSLTTLLFLIMFQAEVPLKVLLLKTTRLCPGCRLIGIELRDANLEGANLKNADLRWSKFDFVNFNHADLRGANLQYVDFNGVTLKDTNLCGAVWIDGSTKQCESYVSRGDRP